MSGWTDEDLDRLLVAMAIEGFELPFAARSSGHSSLESLRAADREAEAENRRALREALKATGQPM